MTAIKWTCQAFEQLQPAQLYSILRLRTEVFVIEQDCVYQDMDNFDSQALHLCGSQDSILTCYARLFAPGVKYPGASIGRVVTAPQARGTGLGRELMWQALEQCHRAWPGAAITISAQHHLERFYNSVDFKTVSAPYLEDGIPHVEMTRAAVAGTANN
ncbi:MAG: GNAT family N-acetyltransferase [Gammaproteobacteria bacterium]|nr:GNAT family N-acetyltransferase [Gammaproteobacteria bacterium]